MTHQHKSKIGYWVSDNWYLHRKLCLCVPGESVFLYSTCVNKLTWHFKSINIYLLKVLINVHAVGVNFSDILTCQGKYQVKAEVPFVPGEHLTWFVR